MPNLLMPNNDRQPRDAFMLRVDSHKLAFLDVCGIGRIRLINGSAGERQTAKRVSPDGSVICHVKAVPVGGARPPIQACLVLLALNVLDVSS
jgi:hypothetical protein